MEEIFIFKASNLHYLIFILFHAIWPENALAGLSHSSFLGMAAICASSCRGQQSNLEDLLVLKCKTDFIHGDCAGLERDHPEFSHLIKKCNIESICSEFKAYQKGQYAACARGYAKSTGDFAESALDFIWNKPMQITDYLGDKLITAIKGLGKNLPSPEGSRNWYKKGLDDIKKLKSTIDQKIVDNNRRYSCFTEIAKEEMDCYSNGLILDPVMLAGMTFRIGKVAKINAETVLVPRTSTAPRLKLLENSAHEIEAAEFNSYLKKYPFLFEHASEAQSKTIFRASSVNVEAADLRNLENLLDPGKNPKNLKNLSQTNRIITIKSYFDKGASGASELGLNHIFEAHKFNGKKVNLLSSWGNKPNKMFGIQSPEKVRIVARAKLGPNTPVLKTSGEYQLFNKPVDGTIDWFLDINGKIYQITDRNKFADFFVPVHKKYFSEYSKLTKDQKALFWDQQMDIRYSKIIDEINHKANEGIETGLRLIPSGI